MTCERPGCGQPAIRMFLGDWYCREHLNHTLDRLIDAWHPKAMLWGWRSHPSEPRMKIEGYSNVQVTDGQDVT